MRAIALSLALLLGMVPNAPWAQESGAQEPEFQEPGAQAEPHVEIDPFTLDPSVTFEAFAAGNFARALDLAITFAARGDAPSMRLLGQMYADGLGATRDEEAAAFWYQQASQAGDIQAKFLLATMLLDGVHVERDETGAANLLQAASDAGNVDALQVLAMLHLEGRGVARDIPRGADMMRQAAEAGDVTAQYTLGILYAEGAGVRQDTAQAFTWFEIAARGGNHEAQIELALGLLSGQADPDERTEERVLEDAVFWLRRAAEGGNPVAENRLAHAHAQGYGVRLDPILAAYYHARAVASGLGDARLDSFVASLSDRQRQEAQNLLALDRGETNDQEPALPANPFDAQR